MRMTETPSRRGRPARQADATTLAAPAPRRGDGRGDRKARAKRTVPLGDVTLRAIAALGNAASAEQVREYLGRVFGMQVRANHLGMALSRHGRAGRRQEADGRWSMVQESGETTA
jgi:hypothetical protein